MHTGYLSFFNVMGKKFFFGSESALCGILVLTILSVQGHVIDFVLRPSVAVPAVASADICLFSRGQGSLI